MQPLDEALGFGMIWGGHDVLDTPYLGELLENLRRELSSAVGSEGKWYSVVLNLAMAEGVDDALGRHVGHGNGYWPPREAVNCG